MAQLYCGCKRTDRKQKFSLLQQLTEEDDHACPSQSQLQSNQKDESTFLSLMLLSKKTPKSLKSAQEHLSKMEFLLENSEQIDVPRLCEVVVS